MHLLQVSAAVEWSCLGAGAIPVRMGVDAKRQLGCVVLREPWRMALFDMAEGEEEEEEEGADEGEEGRDLSEEEDSGKEHIA